MKSEATDSLYTVSQGQVKTFHQYKGFLGALVLNTGRPER